jgi:hypothetical protein
LEIDNHEIGRYHSNSRLEEKEEHLRSVRNLLLSGQVERGRKIIVTIGREAVVVGWVGEIFSMDSIARNVASLKPEISTIR